MSSFFFFQAEDGIRDIGVTGVQTCALPIYWPARGQRSGGARRPSGLARRFRPERWRLRWASWGARGGGGATEIGRASWRERVEISVGGVLLKKKRRASS